MNHNTLLDTQLIVYGARNTSPGFDCEWYDLPRGVDALMNLFSKALNRVLHLFGRRLPPDDDPHSYVMAPKKPRPPHRSAAAVADPPE